MKNTILKRLFTRSNIQAETGLSDYKQSLEPIHRVHADLKHKTDAELHSYHQEIKQNLTQKEEIIPRAFALVKEVIIRKLNLVPYDEQLLGALGLYDHKLIQMQTGEGKTLTAVFAAYLKALEGKGVHVLTFNDYLAVRDAEWMRPVYEFFGLKVSSVREGMSIQEKKKAYHSDITYATAKEVGFDYLRSFVAYDKSELVLRPFHFAIVDEADALLIDEARNPLVLAGDIITPNVDFKRISDIVDRLEAHTDFEKDEYGRNIFLTDSGLLKLEKELEIDNLQLDEHFEVLSSVNLALHARELLQKDVDYVVKDGVIKLVDEFTGRIVMDRKWRNGLQTAVEAKEGLDLKSEGNIINSISLQHLMHQYPELSGMTATAVESAEEFYDFYGLQVLVIPPAKACIREDYPDVIFSSKEEKNSAIIEEIKSSRRKKQPVLVGTLSVKESQALASQIEEAGIPCQVLNAQNNEKEAEIIANAGKPGAVTISTNMAGRGTDIPLGGKKGSEKKSVIGSGGLYVIGTNRHESRRIDNQLRGRAGRQGDPGKSRFFISLEDELMQRYRLNDALPEKIKTNHDHKPLNSKYLKRYFDHIQRVIEGQTYDMRRTLLEYADFVEVQRQIIQNERQKLLTDDAYVRETYDLPADLTETVFAKVKTAVLYIHDKQWAMHLDYLQQVRDSIHLVRIGGEDPLREMKKKADEGFKKLQLKLKEELAGMIAKIKDEPGLNLEDTGIKRPSSTWTYMVNDNPFGNKLGTMLMSGSNIGFQADPISGMLLAFYGMYERAKGWLRK